MKDLIIKTLKEHSTYLDRSRSYEGIYDEQFDYVADALMKQFAISGVVASVLCISDETDCINLTKGKKYTLIESDNIFFRVVNDLGNEQLYYNYRFKRL